MDPSSTPFPTETAGLLQARSPELFELAAGDQFDLHIAPVAKPLGKAIVRMLAYNGSIPGPTLRLCAPRSICRPGGRRRRPVSSSRSLA